MAKGKTNSTNSASSAGSKGVRPALTDGRKPAPGRTRQTGSRRVLANEHIGHVAGEVWQLLDKDGGQSLLAIKKVIDAPGDVILASIGWLAREDKLSFLKSGRSLTISLRQ
jgi:hypothetical protein